MEQTTHPWKYSDPDQLNPSRKGMLLSNEILKFHGNRLLISDGFQASNLRPAAYTLRIGNKYVDSRGKPGFLDEKNPSFKMEPNSIVYVSAHEKLDLPCYIAARFNLRVKWVYKGILLGTGPQVEPGYSGYLSCPLYNLTDRPIEIHFLEDFATIDFERTTDLCTGASSQDITQRIKSGSELDEVEWEGEKYLLFKQKEYLPLKLLPDHDVISSLYELSQEVRTWRHIGIGFAISFFALTMALLSFGASVYRQASDVSSQVNDVKANMHIAQMGPQQSEIEIQALKEKLSALEKEFRETQRNSLARQPK